eukprot:TRINITY_DN548_c0_g5_i1.p2 TRINITY_DN548_c0_g5~~TRINITY_DN548_c0_g5_i1.p2  ORF type:complete len:145 (+),score=17.81 TRINITY_DN548_c0_g5_i1:369-803(+)
MQTPRSRFARTTTHGADAVVCWLCGRITTPTCLKMHLPTRAAPRFLPTEKTQRWVCPPCLWSIATGENLLNPSGGGSVEPEDDDTPDKTTVEELVNSPDGALRTIAEELLRLHKEKREAQVAIPLILEIRLVIPHIDNPHSCGG